MSTSRRTPTSAQLVRNLAGSDSVALNTDCPLAELPAKCEALLERFSLDDYKANFAFIDHLRPLRKDDPVVTDLNLVLDRAHGLRFHRASGGRAAGHAGRGAAGSLHAQGGGGQRRSGRTRPRDGLPPAERSGRRHARPQQGQGHPRQRRAAPIERSHRLRDYLVCEIERDGQLFVLSASEWFHVDADHAEAVNAEVRAIPDVTDDLALPPVKPGEAEGAYNLRAATARGWACLDAQMINVGRPIRKWSYVTSSRRGTTSCA